MEWNGSKISPTSLHEVKNINHKHPKFWDYTQFVLINFAACLTPPCKLGRNFDYAKGMFCLFVLGLHPSLGKKSDQICMRTFFFALQNLSEDLFFCSSPNFGQKIGPNLSEDLFFCSSPTFGQEIGLISDSDLSSQIFWSSCPPPFLKSCVRYCPI